jgi:Asp-tRNA(Asn)/Glu-tRNA(Gln) amidotransferase A subunit family amidase
MIASPNELLRLSAVELRRRIGSKEISPIELLEACIARIQAIDPAVNAMAATDFARARKDAKIAETQARKGEALGRLHGLPHRHQRSA